MSFQKYAPTFITQLGNVVMPLGRSVVSPITLSDTTDLPNGITTGILCVTSGTLAFNLPGSGTGTLVMTAGQFILVNIARALATGTTGTWAAAYN